MYARTLPVIGILIGLFSLLLLLLLQLPSPPPSLQRGSAQAENLVDTSVQTVLVDEAERAVSELKTAAADVSDQSALGTVLASATAQASLIDSAAPARDRQSLLRTLAAASTRIAAQAPTETLIPQPTAEPATPTNTPAAPFIPVTGSVLPQGVPNVVLEADWPKEAQTNHSDFIRVTLVQTSEGLSPTITIEPEAREVITVTPRPIPDSTPQVPIQKAFGDSYKTFVVVKLFYGHAVFDVDGPIPRERQLLDQSELTWKWNITPLEPGDYIISLVVDIEWEPSQEDAQTREPFTMWAQDLEIDVAVPVIRRNLISEFDRQLRAVGILGVFAMVGINAPFLYQVSQDVIRGRRKDQETLV